MRPDLDDYEELNEPVEGQRSRAMSWLVLVVAVGGFAALAYYAYHSGSQSMRDGSVLVVEADPSPIKAQPADPEGEQFANKDKTIYDAITPENGSSEQAEKLLPEPEEPVIPEPAVATDKAAAAPAKAEPNTTTFVNKALGGTDEAVDPVDAQSMKQGGPETAGKEAPKTAVVEAKPAPTEVKEVPVAETAKPVKTVETPATSAPKFVNVKPTPAPEKTAATAKAAPAAKPVPAKTSAATGDYKIQLGALKSEAEAQQVWKKITGKSGDVVKGSPIIIKIDTPNGTLYRLRASGFASADAAKAACAKLSSRGQACMPAGK